MNKNKLVLLVIIISVEKINHAFAILFTFNISVKTTRKMTLKTH